MPLHCLCFACESSTAVVVLVAAALLVVPPGYFIGNELLSSQTLENVNGLDKLANLDVASPKNTYTEYFNYQSVDLLPSVIMLSIGLTVYLYEWIHRKLMERRILKLRAFLGASLERLRETDARREQLEGTLKLARGAAAEYNLLLYLLLRKRKDVPDFNQDNFA